MLQSSTAKKVRYSENSFEVKLWQGIIFKVAQDRIEIGAVIAVCRAMC